MKLFSKKLPAKKVTFPVLTEKVLHQVKGGIISMPDDLELSG